MKTPDRQITFAIFCILFLLAGCDSGGGSNDNFSPAPDNVTLPPPNAGNPNNPPNNPPTPPANDGDGPGIGIDAQLATIISNQDLTGDPSIGRNLPSINDPLPQLGMKLFFSKALSGNQDVACVSCHHPKLGGTDALPLSIGVDAIDPDVLGPGRTHISGFLTVPRNAPTTFNLGLWDKFLFHDGRVESIGKTPGVNGNDSKGIRTPDSAFGIADPLAGLNLATAQARFPVTSEIEMRGEIFEAGEDNAAVRSHLAGRIGDYDLGFGELATNEWLTEFQATFNSSESAENLITFENIMLAIAEYERSQVFVNNPWKSYVQGDVNAISDSAKRGALLFFTPAGQGGASCFFCHQGDFFTNEEFRIVAFPQIGPGVGDGATGDEDFGRFKETGNTADLYTFRTPSLLNVEVTGPYGHSGAFNTLEDVVRHYSSPEASIANFDFDNLDPAIKADNAAINSSNVLATLQNNQAAGIPSIQTLNLSEQQIADLVEFLKALTDPAVKEESILEQWIPGDGDTDPDGLRLEAINGSGETF